MSAHIGSRFVCVPVYTQRPEEDVRPRTARLTDLYRMPRLCDASAGIQIPAFMFAQQGVSGAEPLSSSQTLNY